MWLIIPLRAPESKYSLLVGREYTIGRRDTDIVVANDMSISRKHAVVKVVHPECNIATVNEIPKLVYKDISKLGTLLRNERITVTDGERSVNSGDVLELGTAGVTHYKCVYEPMIVTTSCLDHAGKRALKLNVCKLGGHVVGEWTDVCSLVVMSKLQVTIKVICALVCLKHIVTPQYLADIVSNVEAGAKLPDPGDYQPPLAESQVNPNEVSFRPDVRRGTLFKGMKFVFLNSAQYLKLNAVIAMAGGTCVLAEDKGVETDHALVDGSTCVMWSEVAASQSSQAGHAWVKYVYQLLTKHGRRMITDSEIGFAILHCSTAMQCNPSVTLETSTSGTLPMQTLSAPPTSQLPVETPAHTLTRPANKNFAVPNAPTVSASQIKLEPMSQPPAQQLSQRPASSKRMASDDVGAKQHTKQMRLDAMFSSKSREREREDPMRLEMSSVEPSMAIFDTPLSRFAEKSSAVGRNKVETTFVADSMATDSCRHVDSEENLFDAWPSRRQTNKNVVGETVRVCEIKTESHLLDAESPSSVVDSNDSERRCQLVRHEAPPPCLVRGSAEENTSSLSADKNAKTSKNEDLLNTIMAAAGFLRCKKSAKINLDEADVKDENDQDSFVVVEERSLILPRQARRQSLQVIPRDDSVKNFKTFRKSTLFPGLPRIIGGHDLVVYDCVTPVQQDLFERVSQTESEKIVDNLSDELFNFEPSKRKNSSKTRSS